MLNTATIRYHIATILLFGVSFVFGQIPTSETHNSNSSFFYSGFPLIHNYGPTEYNGHAQCWGIAQDREGLMYFGNTEGILQYDGNSWHMIQLPNKSLVRKIVMASDNKLYCTGNGDLGFISKDSIGGMMFSSLLSYLPEEARKFNEIWNLVAHENKVFFNTFYKLFIWDIETNTFDIIEAPVAFGNTFLIGDEVWVPSAYEGLQKYDQGQLLPIDYTGAPTTRTFSAVKVEDGKTVTTFNEGIYITDGNKFKRVPSEIDELIPNRHILDATALDNNQYALLSAHHGLYIMSTSGQLIKHLDTKNGLPSANVHDAFIDNNNSLWLTSNFGVSKIEANLPIRVFDSRNKIEDTVNDILRYNDTLFVTTHSGLFYTSTTILPEFKRVGSSISEAFDMEIVNGDLIIGTSDGVFRKNTGINFEKINHSYCDQLVQSTINSNILFLGTIDGLFSLTIESSQYTNPKSYADFVPDDIQSMTQDSLGNLWIGTSGTRLYMLDFFNKGNLERPIVNIYNHEDGLPISNIQIHNLGDRLAFSSEEGVYDLIDGRFVRSEDFSEFKKNVYSIKKDRRGTTHILHDNPPFMKVTTYINDGKNYLPNQAPELDYIRSFGLWESYEDSDGSIWYGTTDGVLNYIPLSYTPPKMNLLTNISEVKVNQDSLISVHVNNGGSTLRSNTKEASETTLSYSENTIRFEYSLPSYINVKGNEFQYMLEGLEENWSSWNTETTKEYVELFEGQYTFMVRGRNVQQVIGDVAVYHFTISPPWYRTWWFLTLTLLFIITTLASTIRYFSQKKLLARVKELELEQKVQKERERISSDLHDHVGAQLTSIISGLSITEQMKELENNDQLKDLMESLKEDARNTMVNLRDSIWSLNNEIISLTELSEHIDTYLESYLKYYPLLNHSVHAEEANDCLIGHTEGLNITRIIQESVQNIIKHAKAKRIDVRFTYENHDLIITISDDGIGFSSAESGGEHYGIQNMKRRMEEVGGNFKIQSSPNQGTEVHLTIPNYPKKGIVQQ